MFKKVLILRLSAIGDTIHTLPVVNALKAAYPDCQTGWVVEDKAALFVEKHPNVDKCYILPKKLWKKRGLSPENVKEFFDIIKDINSEHYDIVLDTQQLFKSAILLPFLNIKRKITLSGGREFSGLFSNEKVKASHELFNPDYHVVKRNLELAEYLGANAENIEFKLAPPSEEVQNRVNTLLFSLNPDKKNVVISPATTWKNKHWDEDCWREVLSYLESRANLIFTGTENDLPLIERISNGINGGVILAGKTNLEELACVFSRADVVISPDSGSAHIAWATAHPKIITLFFATSSNRTAPYGEKYFSIQSKTECSPCMKKHCKLKSNKNKCIQEISSEEIINIVKKVLQ